MQLTFGTTPWSYLDPPDLFMRYPCLEEEIRCDVVVIGGGISGILAASMLTEQGAETVLMEKKSVCCQSTGANTGLLQFMNDDTLTQIIQMYGDKRGTAIYTLCQNAIVQLGRIAADLSVDVQFTPRSSLYYSSVPEEAGALRQEYDLLKRKGFPVEYWDRQQIKSAFPFSRSAAIYAHGDAEVNPYRLGHGLLEKAERCGLRIYENSGVNNVSYTDEEIIVFTDKGTVRAKNIIWASGYSIQEWKPDSIADLVFTYALMTEPVQDLSWWHERALIWESHRPYLYFRTTPDNRILAGGLDEPVRKLNHPTQLLQERSARLLHELIHLFPTLGSVRPACSWGGVFANTVDGLPLIGPHPDYPHSYFIEAYGGNGMVYSVIAARLLTDTLAGRRRKELEWFSLDRTLGTHPHSSTIKTDLHNGK